MRTGNQKPLNIKRRIAIGIGLGICLLVGIFIWGANSDAFHAAENAIRSSELITTLVGKVKTVSLSPVGGFHLSYAGETGTGDMEISVKGETGEARVHVELVKKSGLWKVTGAQIHGAEVAL